VTLRVVTRGVVSGLRVRAGDQEVVVSPGIAIDSRDDDLALEEPASDNSTRYGDVALPVLRYVDAAVT